MFNINDYVVYKKDVCLVKDIKENKIDKSLHYVLVPINDDTLRIEVPSVNRLGLLRKLITKEELNNIIKSIPSIETIDENDRLIENEYKELLKEGSFNSLIKIIKTTYIRNKNREENKKRQSDKDTTYFRLAEKYLYTEFSIVLNKSFDDTMKYVESEVLKIINNEL